MGNIADYYTDRSIEFQEAMEIQAKEEKKSVKEYEILKSYVQGSLFWTQKNGEQINITDMTRTHLSNCLRMLMHGDNPTNIWCSIFVKEINTRINNK